MRRQRDRPRVAYTAAVRRLSLLLILAACTRDSAPQTAASRAADARSVVAAADGCAIDVGPAVRPAPARLVAIGDVHGDLAATRAVLRLAGAIDERDRWIGGEL